MWVTVQVTGGWRWCSVSVGDSVGDDVCDRVWVTGAGDKTLVTLQMTVCTWLRVTGCT